MSEVSTFSEIKPVNVGGWKAHFYSQRDWVCFLLPVFPSHLLVSLFFYRPTWLFSPLFFRPHVVVELPKPCFVTLRPSCFVGSPRVGSSRRCIPHESVRCFLIHVLGRMARECARPPRLCLPCRVWCCKTAIFMPNTHVCCFGSLVTRVRLTVDARRSCPTLTAKFSDHS